MVDVNSQTTCLGFVEMKGVKAEDPSMAAAVVGARVLLAHKCRIFFFFEQKKRCNKTLTIVPFKINLLLVLGRLILSFHPQLKFLLIGAP